MIPFNDLRKTLADSSCKKGTWPISQRRCGLTVSAPDSVPQLHRKIKTMDTYCIAGMFGGVIAWYIAELKVVGKIWQMDRFQP